MAKSVHYSTGKDDWQTPKDLYDKLDAEFHFDFDPCPANPTFDGLSIPWKERNFVNPPYSRGRQSKWIGKAWEEWKHKDRTVVMLLPARTDTKTFHRYFWNSAKHKPYEGIEIRFLKGRVKFIDPATGEPKHGAQFPSMVVVMR